MALEIIAYAEKNLAKGEKIVYQTTTHWIIILRPLLIIFAGIAAMSFAGNTNVEMLKNDPVNALLDNPYIVLLFLGALLCLQGLLFLFLKILMIVSTEITVTTRKVIWKSGIFWRDTDEMLRVKVEGCKLDSQSWLGQILNYGTIEVKGTGGNVLSLNVVTEPLLLRSYISRAPRRKTNATSQAQEDAQEPPTLTNHQGSRE